MTTKRAFVLSSGASEGAVQVGMLKALAEAGVEPDLIVGSSVGAINGAVIAGAPGPGGVSRLEKIWHSIRRADVFPLTPIVGFLGFIGRHDHLVSHHALRRLISAHVVFPRLEEFPTSLAVMATDLVTGRDIPLTSGPSVTALLASAAIPGVFPRAIGTLLRALTIMLGTRLAIAIQLYENQVRLKVVPPPCPSDVSPIDFSRTDTLIDTAYETARSWLTSEPPVTGQAHLAAPSQRAPQ